MGKSREQQILEAGLAKLGPEHKLVLTPIVTAMAAMIAEATKPKAKRAKDPEASRFYAEGQEVERLLRSWAPGAVAWEPVQSSTLVALGKTADKVSNHDLDCLGAYLAGGGLAWMKEKPTTSYIARNLVDLVAKARAAAPSAQESALDKVRDR